LPQTVKVIGGYRKFANDKEEAQDIFTDAIALEEAGCFAIVCEMIREEVATELTRHLEIPTIGIGSGPGCDGQILVTTDVLGLTTGDVPSFVKPYAQLAGEAGKALGRFVGDVREGRYPKA
jgi:3-methyl-2-oxobutanoate hydroxymethyltransferase